MNKITHTKPDKQKQLKVGQFYFRTNEDGTIGTYIVAKIDCQYVLICLEDGMYWTLPSQTVTNVFGQSSEEFELVTNSFTITPQ